MYCTQTHLESNEILAKNSELDTQLIVFGTWNKGVCEYFFNKVSTSWKIGSFSKFRNKLNNQKTIKYQKLGEKECYFSVNKQRTVEKDLSEQREN